MICRYSSRPPSSSGRFRRSCIFGSKVGPEFYPRIVKPQFMATVRSVVSGYNMVTVPEKSAEIASKVQAVVVEKLKGRHLEIQISRWPMWIFRQLSCARLSRNRRRNRRKNKKNSNLLSASKDAEIARTRAKGEGDSIRIRAEGEAEGYRIRAAGQAKAQETITQTLTPAYLRYKLYDSPNSKLIFLPDQLKAPILINPGEPPGRSGHAESRLPKGQGEQRFKMYGVIPLF